MQPASYDIWNKKYALKDAEGNLVDNNVEESFERVAEALASGEKDKDFYREEFYKAMLNGATPAGRIVSNAGAEKYKARTSLINCTVSDTINDSMEGILEGIKRAGLTLKAGCGIGYEFSTLRPSGAFVDGVGATTSGPLSFMDIYDKMCFTISSAGGRRGAQMATFDISHPDALEFIKAKREDGRFRQFNLSLLITKDFVEAVKNDEDWNFVFPVNKCEYNEKNAYVWKQPNYEISKNEVVYNDLGLVAHKIYTTEKASVVWDTIMKSTYDFAEPGFILIDKVNELNNNWFCENIRATNPCLTGDAIVMTDKGSIDMKSLVERYKEGEDFNATCFNIETNEIENKQITFADLTRKDATIIEIELDDGKSIKLTPDHKVYTNNRGYVEAQYLNENDNIVIS